MNMLVDTLESIIESKLGNIEINTDFRISILFELLMQDNTISKKEKIAQAIRLYYPNFLKITDFNKAIEDIIWFYNGGKELGNSRKKNKEEKRTQIYSYEFDDEYIYSAFMQQYNIDLQDIENLHWWKFKALFSGLSENTKIVEIMGYRAINLKKIKDKEKRNKYKKLKELYALPDMRSREEKERDFALAFLK